MIFEGMKNNNFFRAQSNCLRSVSALKKSRKFAFDNYDIKVKCGKQISLRGVEICCDTRPSNQPSL